MRDGSVTSSPNVGDNDAALMSPAALKGLLEAIAPGRLVAVAVEIGLFGAVGSTPVSAAEVARSTDTAEEPTTRVLRALGALGLVQDSGGGYVLTHVGHLLRDDAPDSLAPVARFIGTAGWDAWTSVGTRMRVGADLKAGSTFARLYASGGYPLFAAQMEAAGQRAGRQIAALLRLEDDARFVDIGGGSGAVTAALLQHHPGWTALVFDQAWAEERARAYLDARVHGRWEFVVGDFFVELPSGETHYLLSRVLHDWDDAHAVAILERCRAAMRSDSSLFVYEKSLDGGDASVDDQRDFFMTDINTWLMCGGRERTLTEFSDLARRAGLQLDDRIRTSGSHWLLRLSIA